ncbi:MBL fold metallo-hydrolase [Candidatus Endomicrobiellum devescovinae]|jgi:metallo-beta-lactamase family protein|uniref:MBL fold metallo-hydrolase n=1 Tax=Candidatus Endomicrobiellum devescovinae TaxID=3242322 RepID=UPI0028209A6B|nr:MBL fold metallo-hydrolase [Endomicrobium sp.]
MCKLASVVCVILFFILPLFADISVTPYGAAETVSGSCFLLDTGAERIIVDCGLFMSSSGEQGIEPFDLEESLNLKIQKELIDAKALFLTHAHLDHSGRIPLLIYEGFKGKIYSTKATKELAIALFKERNGFDLIKRKWFWSESQYEKAEEKNGTVVAHWTEECKKNIKSIGYSKDEMLLKDLEKNEKVKFILCKNCCERESEKISEKFVNADYNEEIKISDSLKVKLINAGHIPGSASIIFSTDKEKVLFSGDLGSGNSKFNGEFEIPESVDLIFMEATYGGKVNHNVAREYELFRKDLKNALESGKTVWIPAFALNRTQEVLYELKLMQDDGYISTKFPIYSVSPSANAITALYQKEVSRKEDEDHEYSKSEWFLETIYQKKSILPENTRLQMIRNYEMQMILFSSSGDMDKGKSKQLAPILLHDKNVFVMVVNYVDPESSAGLLLRNKKPRFDLKKLAAKIKRYNVFSDHADFEMLQKWLSKQSKDAKIYVIHSNKQTTAQTVSLLQEKGWSGVKGAQLGKTVQ